MGNSVVSGETIDWCSEYIARHAPLSLRWLEQPVSIIHGTQENLECKGLGLVSKTTALAASEDCSICFWNLENDTDQYSKIIARSRSGLLCFDKRARTGLKSSDAPRLPSTGIVECVSIDKARNKGYFAVQAGLAEVDLLTLQVTSYSRYSQPISVLSEAAKSIPLTVGTTQALHIFDPRIGEHYRTPSANIGEQIYSNDDVYRIHVSDHEHAVLSQPLPLSLLHASTDMIHVAGRFPSILTYDRRFFPQVTSAVHSGSRLSCITSFPSASGKMLAAVGEYNGKGSLELYPLSAASRAPTQKAYRNRTTAARSKCLSLVSHGTRLLFSDSDGMLKWIETDGSTLVRQWNINTHSSSNLNMPEPEVPMNGIFSASTSEGDVARKVLPLTRKANSDVLVWTGEKVGLLSAGSGKRIDASKRGNSEEEGASTINPESTVDGDRAYGRLMRRALERQADEVRFVRGLGLSMAF